MPTKEWVRGKSTVVTIGPLQNSARYGMPRQVRSVPSVASKDVDWPLSKSISSVIGKSGPTSRSRSFLLSADHVTSRGAALIEK